MRGILFLLMLGGGYGIAAAAGASPGWASGIAWAIAIAGAFVLRRIALYRAYARQVMSTPEYKENARRAEEFFRSR